MKREKIINPIKPERLFEHGHKAYCPHCQQETVQYKFTDNKIRCNSCTKVVDNS